MIQCAESGPRDTNEILSKQIKREQQLIQKSAVKFEEIVQAIKKLKVNWTEGSETLIVRRKYVFEDSFSQFNQIDLKREIKIVFENEVSNDAGGLFREWATLLFKEVFAEETNLFERSDNAEFSYNIKPIEPTFEALQKFHFLGQAIAKTLLENNKVSLCLNFLLFKLIMEEEVKYTDLPKIDCKFYQSVESLKKLDSIAELGLFYEYTYEKEGKIVAEELFPGGGDKIVTDLEDYVDKRIGFLVEKNLIMVEALRSGFTSIIPFSFVSGLSAEEFEILVNGRVTIDVNDWQVNTVYDGYESTDKTVKIFWKVMKMLDQQDLQQFLVFATGNSRVPIGGFAALESNRENKAPFQINKTFGSFLKSHTCFNRIELPEIKEEAQMQECILLSIQNMDAGFGLE